MVPRGAAGAVRGAAPGPREWLALKQHFAAPEGATLRCVHDTWIKKSEANSRSLPPAEKLQVAQGATLLLTKPPARVDDGYWLVQCESSGCMLHTLENFVPVQSAE